MTGGGSPGEEVGDDVEADAVRDGDPREIEPADIGPMGALIAVAFTGAVIAMVGFMLSLFVGDAALVFVLLGFVVVLASPVAYLRFRAVGAS